MKFEHVLVVGAGQVGGGIAQVVAGSGRRVSLCDAAPGAVDRGLGAMQKSLSRPAEKGVFRRADELYAPCPLLRQRVHAGRLGRKSGRGFYVYS